jgi:hypothetical protein
MRGVVAAAVLSVVSFAVHSAEAPDPLVKRHLEAKGTPYTIDDDNDFAITVDFGNGRSQKVFVISNTYAVDGIRVRELWSAGYESQKGGVIPETVANRLLEHSQEVVLGSWVKQKGGYGIFVIKIPHDASADDLDTAIDTVASSADEIEEEFTGDKDAF